MSTRRNMRVMFSVVLTVAVGLLVPGVATAQPLVQGVPPGCDVDAVNASKARFLALSAQRTSTPASVTEDAVRQASVEYVTRAEVCYQGLYGAASTSPTPIDNDGLWFGPSGSQPFATLGTKWGAGSPFTGGTTVPGPRIAGGTVTYSYMTGGISIAAEGSDASVAVTSLPTYAPCFLTEISNAFAAWSSVANIQFVQVADNGVAFNASGASGDIRIAAHTFDGPSNVLAHTYYPPPNGATAAGDMHFDRQENWACTPGGGAIDIGIVATHELGHAIGLNHEMTLTAIMNPYYNASLSGPLADDVTGAVSIYGPAVVSVPVPVPNPSFSATPPTAATPAVVRAGDFDGDRKADAAVYRASNGNWYVTKSGGGTATYGWGLASDVPVQGDFDGDGKLDLAVYRPSTSTWYICWSSNNFATFTGYAWGTAGDVPKPGDYDGDGKTDIAVYRPSTGGWWVLKSSTTFTTFSTYAWGLAGDLPVPGDYDGDGKVDPAIYRPTTGGWWILKSSSSYTTYANYAWGLGGDQPVAADYDGDGKADPAIYRPTTGGWWILKSSTGFTGYMNYSWGLSGDVPVPGDYDADGKTDAAIFRASTGGWWILQTSNGAYANIVLGTTGDTPLLLRP